MKYDLYKDGEHVMSIIGTDDSIDFTSVRIVPEEVVNNCSMSADTFESIFHRCISKTSSYVEAYRKAEDIHEQFFGNHRYSSYHSFVTARSRNK